MGRLDLLGEHLVHLHHLHRMDIVPSAKEHKMVMDKKCLYLDHLYLHHLHLEQVLDCLIQQNHPSFHM